VNLRNCTGDPVELSRNWYSVREWTVRTLVDNARIGTVHELLLDDHNIPRYLDVSLHAPARHVLLPIGHARADRGHNQVWLPGLAEPQFAGIPSYDHAALTRGDEMRLLSAYGGTLAGAERRHGYRVLGGADRRRLKPQDPRRLVPLAELNAFRVAARESDPRGWSVVDRDHTVVGFVSDLLIDLATMKARYLICELAVNDEEARRVLVPVEFVRLDRSAHAAALPSFTPSLFAELDSYDGEPPKPEREAHMLERFAEAQTSEDFYDHARFDPNVFFGSA
jgi:photosynthetic reaction center H subunit